MRGRKHMSLLNTFPAESIRADFPIFERKINGRPIVYLDNAATTQAPKSVISSINEHYTNLRANVHRGVHTLSQEATAAMEAAREAARRFIGAASTDEIIFTRGTTAVSYTHLRAH